MYHKIFVHIRILILALYKYIYIFSMLYSCVGVCELNCYYMLRTIYDQQEVTASQLNAIK